VFVEFCRFLFSSPPLVSSSVCLLSLCPSLLYSSPHSFLCMSPLLVSSLSPQFSSPRLLSLSSPYLLLVSSQVSSPRLLPRSQPRGVVTFTIKALRRRCKCLFSTFMKYIKVNDDVASRDFQSKSIELQFLLWPQTQRVVKHSETFKCLVIILITIIYNLQNNKLRIETIFPSEVKGEDLASSGFFTAQNTFFLSVFRLFQKELIHSGRTFYCFNASS